MKDAEVVGREGRRCECGRDEEDVVVWRGGKVV